MYQKFRLRQRLGMEMAPFLKFAIWYKFNDYAFKLRTKLFSLNSNATDWGDRNFVLFVKAKIKYRLD